MKHTLPTVITYKSAYTGSVHLSFGDAGEHGGEMSRNYGEMSRNYKDSEKITT